MDILENTKRLLLDADETMATIAERSGVSVRYLAKIKSGNVKRPSYYELQKVHSYLTSKRVAA